MIKQFDTVVLGNLRTEMNEALKGIAEKYGMTIDAGKATYGNSYATFKVELALVKADGSVGTREATMFRMYAKMLGMSPDDLGREFESNGKKYKLTGYNPSKRKYPFVAEHDGKEYGFTENFIRTKFA
jgi:hypothetical protein